MVFDTPEMEKLRETYSNQLSFHVPEIVFFDRYEGRKQERAFIEELVQDYSPEKLKDWLGNFINTDRRQHISAWFEIMVYSWLNSHFQVQIEPEINGRRPDFLIQAGENQILIESIAYLYSPEELLERSISSEVAYWLETIERPYAVDVEHEKYGTSLNKKDLINKVTFWIDHFDNERLNYSDKFGNIIHFHIAYKTGFNKIAVRVDGNVQLINTDEVKKPLHRKIKHHQLLSDDTHPYVIAIYLESWQYSADEVIEAWFGKTVTIFDPKTGNLLGERNDQTGLAFHRKKIQNRGISGILVFKRTEYPYDGNQILNCWYVQNPYARNPIDSDVFTADGRFIVMQVEDNLYKMDWIGLCP